MILLKYAKLLPLDYQGDLSELKLERRDLDILRRRTKEFVLCGYQITAEQAILLSNYERVALYQARNTFIRECVALLGLATKDNKEAAEQVFKANWSEPETENDRISDYLALVGLKYA